MRLGAVALGLLLNGTLATVHGQDATAWSPRTNYLERCGGCHGTDGHSTSTLVPDLKDRVGYFLCNADSRDFMGRLPNIVFSGLNAPQLAALLNYVVFGLGAASAPRGARPYTAAEVARDLRSPLTTTNLLAYRRRIVKRVIEECGAPESFLTLYNPPRSPSMTADASPPAAAGKSSR